ncbi:MAG: HDIG domain-containing protein [Actinomycetia bacterium]|nr:HDIG domain-containing protein [Actinomycetes bacterium]
MNREEAYQLIKGEVKNKNLIKHMLAVEAIMKTLAKKLGEDEEKWGLTGLLHDIDYEITAKDPHKHSIVGADMLKEIGLDDEIVNAVRAHNDMHKIKRITTLEKALFCVDPLTGLIVAAALIHPDKKLASIDHNFILNRFKEKAFARGAKREQIKKCSELGFELKEFIKIGLLAMQNISEELDL